MFKRAVILIFMFSISILTINSGDNSEYNLVVTNNSDDINGDISDISSLIRNPGRDGISFREAVKAAERYNGKKIISFSPNMKDMTITIESGNTKREIFILSSGNLTIDGDIDSDCQPDITIDGSFIERPGDHFHALVIWSSSNIIKNLNLINFKIIINSRFFAPIENVPRRIYGNRIFNNSIIDKKYGIAINLSNHNEGFVKSGFYVGTTLIANNDIFVEPNKDTSWGLWITAGCRGASNNVIEDVKVIDNRIKGGTIGIEFSAADCASDWPDQPVKNVYYSESNKISKLLIMNNIIIHPQHDGIKFMVANGGNMNNMITDIKVKNNFIIEPGNYDIHIAAGTNSGARSTAQNGIEDITISDNILIGGTSGIISYAGCLHESDREEYVLLLNNNTIRNITIEHNDIMNTIKNGIFIISGSGYMSDDKDSEVHSNLIEHLNINDNQIRMSGNNGIEIISGWSFGTTFNNIIRDVNIINNKIKGARNAIHIVAGKNEHRFKSYSNTITNVLINKNELSTNFLDNRDGILIIGGWAKKGTTYDNSITNIQIVENMFLEKNCISIIGGKGKQSYINKIVISKIGNNTMANNQIPQTIINNDIEGARDSSVESL